MSADLRSESHSLQASTGTSLSVAPNPFSACVQQGNWNASYSFQTEEDPGKKILLESEHPQSWRC